MNSENIRNILLRALVSLACVNFSLSKGDGGQQNWPQQGWGGGQTKGPLGGWDDEPSNPWGGDGGGWKLEDSIPGIPGQSYPNFDKIPDTSFDCRRQKNPGYYGDVESQCQVFHICQAGGRQNSFLCPIGTIFNQESFVCDWWFNVNCGEASTHYDRNGNLFRGSDIGIDGSKIMRKGLQENSKGSNQPSTVGIPSWGSQGGDDGSWGMKGNADQGGQQNPWRNQGGSNKGVSSRRGRPKANGGGHNKGSARGNQGGQSWQSGGNPGFQNQGNQKGIGMGGNQGNQKGLGMGGSQGGQKGFGIEGNVNPGWGQQGNNRVNSGRNNKGMVGNQIRADRGGGFGQKGDMSGGNNRIQRRSGMGPNSKGGRRGQKGQGGNNMRPGNAGGGMGNQGSKGTGTDNRSFSANSWSMGSQNFQFSSFQEKSDAFSKGTNAKGGSSSYQENNPWQGPGVNDNFQQGEHFKGEDGNNNWNNGNSNFNQWGSRVPEYQPTFGENNAGGQDNWRADYDAPDVNSFNFNDKGSFEGQAGENDYDYVWNS